MTILNRIISVVKEKGAITLQGIYDALPDIDEAVIRGTINRYVCKKDDKEIDRLKRGIYVSINKNNEDNVLDFKCSSLGKRTTIISKFKSLLQKKQINSYYNNMVAGLEGQISFNELDLVNFNELDNNNINYYNLSNQPNTGQKSNENLNLTNLTNTDINKSIENFDNKIFNEDSRDFLKKIEDECIDLIVTDPPYLTDKRGRGKNTTTGGMLATELTCKGKIFKHNSINIKEYINDFFRVLKDGGHCYIMTNQKNLIEMLNESVKAGFHFVKSLIWKKNNKGCGHSYMSQFEYILFFRKGKFKKINNCGTSNILEFDNKKLKKPMLDENGNPVLDKNGNIRNENLHDTEKPVSLMKVLVENSSKPFERVLDPFCGIGAVAIACKELGRKFICNEIDKTYRDIAKARVDEIVPIR